MARIFTGYIDENDCMGDSLGTEGIINEPKGTINGSTLTLDVAVQSLSGNLAELNETISGLATLIGIRLSLDPSTPTPTTDREGAAAQTLYVHPYRGNIITLWNSGRNRWTPYQISGVRAFPLLCPSANTNYDIFLFNNNGNLAVEYVPWPDSSAGALPPTRTYKDGIVVRSASEPNKRFVGCLRTTSANMSEQTFGKNIEGGANCKQYLWNAQNQIPITAYSFESGTYYATGGANGWTPWRRVNPNGPGSGYNNRFSFIVGESTLVNMTAQVYTSYYVYPYTNNVTYVALGVNNGEYVTLGSGSQMVSELRGSDMTPRAQLMKSFTGGYNFVQLFELLYVGPWATATMNEGHQNQTGYIVSMFN